MSTALIIFKNLFVYSHPNHKTKIHFYPLLDLSNNLQSLSKPPYHSNINTPYSSPTAAPHHMPGDMPGISGRQTMTVVMGSLGAIRTRREFMTRVFGGSRGRFRSAMQVMHARVMARELEAVQSAELMKT